ncbi:hypothetical protein E2C01_038544 [Portunus trituberculatus]|uniref:Uncharacterized protein n=1 Tax=Portunus trituberculatus TaxID=210409 RepID=A0A5B7FEE9_PORTR|nr:hypothetical protein [Portunus trituberculatus]
MVSFNASHTLSHSLHLHRLHDLHYRHHSSVHIHLSTSSCIRCTSYHITIVYPSIHTTTLR